jgi:DNA-binding MarR family transcriptional regulator
VATDCSERDEHVGFALRLAYQRASANHAQAKRAGGVTPIQFQTLLQLSHAGQITQNQLGRSIGMPPANIHRIVRALLAAELVTVASSAGDKRVALVELTPHGQQTLREMLPAADAANALTLSALSPSNQATVMDNLSELANGPKRVRPPEPAPRAEQKRPIQNP